MPLFFISDLKFTVAERSDIVKNVDTLNYFPSSKPSSSSSPISSVRNDMKFRTEEDEDLFWVGVSH